MILKGGRDEVASKYNYRFIWRTIFLLSLTLSCISVSNGGKNYSGIEFALSEQKIAPMVGYAHIRADNSYVYSGIRYRFDEIPLDFTLAVGYYNSESLDLEFKTGVDLYLNSFLSVGGIHLSGDKNIFLLTLHLK